MAEELLQRQTFLSLLSSWYAEVGKMQNQKRKERGGRLMAEEVPRLHNILSALFLLMTFCPLPATSLPQDMSLSHLLEDGVSPLRYGHIHKESEGLADVARGADTFFRKSELLVGKCITLPDLHEQRAFSRRTLSKGLPFRNRYVPSLLEMPMNIPPASEFAQHMLSLCDGTGVQRAEAIACVISMEEMEQFATSRLGSFDVEVVEPSGWQETRGFFSEQKKMLIREVRLMGSGMSKRSVVCDEVMMGAWVCREMEGMEKMEVRLGRKEGKEADSVLLLHCYKQRKWGESCDENEVCEWVSSERVVWVMKIEEEEGMIMPPVQARAPWMNEKHLFHHHHHHHHRENLIHESKTELKIPFFKFEKKHKDFSDGGGHSNINRKGSTGLDSSEKSMENPSNNNAGGSPNPETGSGSMDQSTGSPPPPEGGAGGAAGTEGGAGGGTPEGGGTPPAGPGG